MNVKYLGVMAFYAYLTVKAGPDYFGTPSGYIAGAVASYALYETVGRNFVQGSGY